MKKYKVNVNGIEYEITMEIIEDDGKSAVPAAALKAAPAEAPKAAPVAAPTSAAAPRGSGKEIKSPMPGSILDISVNVGDKVQEGQLIMILEAMKMENEIMAPVAGTVTSIAVSKGDSVESGTLLYAIA